MFVGTNNHINLYLFDTSGLQQIDIGQTEFRPFAIDIFNQNLIMLSRNLSSNDIKIQVFDPGSHEVIDQYMFPSEENMWIHPMKLAMLKTGPVVTDIKNHCAHAFTQQGSHVFTLGQCGKASTEPGMFLYLVF